MSRRCANSPARGRNLIGGFDVSDSTTSPEGPNPSGLCMCGCGERAPIADRNDSKRSRVKGQPLRYLSGHNPSARKPKPDYTIDAFGCWVWAKALDPQGYGITNSDRRVGRAHRIYYERIVGPIPEGLQLDHLCRNRACVNPAHLEPVTQAENNRRGAATKLNESLASDIRRLGSRGLTHKEIAARFPVSESQVGRIIAGRAWSVGAS